MTDQNNSPPTPSTQPVASGVTWMTIVGAIFAAILLIFFLILGGYAAISPAVQFNCAAFSFLAVAFAIGSAAAGAFLGGGAAIEGRLGSTALNHPVRFSLVGGVAVLIICLFAFFVLKPSDCQGVDETVTFERIPSQYEWKIDHDFWMRNKLAANGADATYEVMVRKNAARGSVYVKEGADTVCRFSISFQRGAIDDQNDYREFVMQEPGDLRLTYAENQNRKEKITVHDCFQHDGQIVDGELIIALGSKKAYLSLPKITDKPTQSEFEAAEITWPADSLKNRTSWLSFNPIAQKAFAQVLYQPPNYERLKEKLSYGKDHEVAAARQYLSENFKIYKNEILNEIFEERSRQNGNLTASLLSALISGIEEEQPDLRPGEGRDLSQSIKLILGREHSILTLVEHNDASVRQQARRLVQRFPINKFENFFKVALASPCHDMANKRRLYASVFYFYNRIIQQRLNENFEEDDVTFWRMTSLQIKDKFSVCLDPPEKYDAALLDYGLSTVTRWSGRRDLSLAFAEEFMDFISQDPSSYYRQSHIEKIEGLLSGN